MDELKPLPINNEYPLETKLEEGVGRLGVQLWRAAKCAKKAEVESLLQQGAPVNFELSWFAKDALLYKHRTYTSQPIHAAALYDPEKDGSSCPEERRQDATEIVRLLLDSRANAMARARSSHAGLDSKEGREGKTRSCEAIHFATGSGNMGVLSLLLRSRASPNAGALLSSSQASPNAEAKLDEDQHYYMPLHDAVWFNRRNPLRLLLDSRADIKAKNIDGHTGLHLAARLGYSQIARELILGSDQQTSECVSSRRPANPISRPHSRSSSMTHLGSLVSARIEGEEVDTVLLENALDKKGKTPLDNAIEIGQFPPQELWLFTYNLRHDDRAEAFVKVAEKCPFAASALLSCKMERAGTEFYGEGIVSVDDDWKRSLQQGATKTGLITPLVLARLIINAPQAAVDLLEALTDIPYVTDPQDNPLPIRARICSSMMPLRAAYELDIHWEWNSDDVARGQRGPKCWQVNLAPRDPQGGQEVLVRVLKLPGVISLCVIHGLACTTDFCLFSQIQVHALLYHLWHACFRLFFVLDLMHEGASLGIISAWVVAKKPDSAAVNEALWCFVVAQSITECLNYAAMSWNCSVLGARNLIRFWVLSARDIAIPLLTLSMAYLTIDDMYWSSKDDCIVLSVTVFSHWLRMLYQLRAFWWTGQKLLPILKSIHSVYGMLIILAFLVMAFVHAFWALNIDNSPGLTLYDVSVMVLTGSDFVETSDLQGMDASKRVTTIAFVVLALFLVLTCALNVFIAVLGHHYELEQERLICTFMKERAKICCALFLRPSCGRLFSSMCRPIIERAKICCALFLRPSCSQFCSSRCTLIMEWARIQCSSITPKLPCPHRSHKSNPPHHHPQPHRSATSAWKVCFAFTAGFLIIDIYFLILTLTSLFSAPQWVSACLLTVALLSVRLAVRSSYVDSEDERFLWMCYVATQQDSMHLRSAFNDKQDASGQVLGMKHYFSKQCKVIDDKTGKLSGFHVKEPDIIGDHVKPQVKEAACSLSAKSSVAAQKRKKQPRTLKRQQEEVGADSVRVARLHGDA